MLLFQKTPTMLVHKLIAMASVGTMTAIISAATTSTLKFQGTICLMTMENQGTSAPMVCLLGMEMLMATCIGQYLLLMMLKKFMIPLEIPTFLEMAQNIIFNQTATMSNGTGMTLTNGVMTHKEVHGTMGKAVVITGHLTINICTFLMIQARTLKILKVTIALPLQTVKVVTILNMTLTMVIVGIKMIRACLELIQVEILGFTIQIIQVDGVLTQQVHGTTGRTLQMVKRELILLEHHTTTIGSVTTMITMHKVIFSTRMFSTHIITMMQQVMFGTFLIKMQERGINYPLHQHWSMSIHS